jgi:rubrerythrin
MSVNLDFAKLGLMDALDLATLIEVEAYKRYVTFSKQLGFGGGAAEFFASMAENEAKHGKELSAQRKQQFGDAPAQVTLGDLFDVEAPEMGAIRSTMSTLQAFEVALAAEQKAFDFYNDALPHIKDPQIHALFIELRDEEVEHIRMVREGIEGLPPEASIEHELDLDESPFL